MVTKNKKNVIIISVLVIAAIIAYKLNQNKNKPDSNGGSGKDGTPTSDIDFGALANDLFDAFDGYGTKNQKVRDIFSLLKSDLDFDDLVKAYGIRTVSCGAFNPFCTDFKGGLEATIKDEANDTEIVTLNKILSDKGINKRI